MLLPKYVRNALAYAFLMHAPSSYMQHIHMLVWLRTTMNGPVAHTRIAIIGNRLRWFWSKNLDLSDNQIPPKYSDSCCSVLLTTSNFDAQ